MLMSDQSSVRMRCCSDGLPGGTFSLAAPRMLCCAAPKKRDSAADESPSLSELRAIRAKRAKSVASGMLAPTEPEPASEAEPALVRCAAAAAAIPPCLGSQTRRHRALPVTQRSLARRPDAARAAVLQAESYSSASMISFYKCNTDPTGPYSRPATPDTVTDEYASLERRHARATEPRTVESYMSSEMVSFYR